MRVGADLQITHAVAVRGVDSSAIESLSAREREVLGMAATGQIDKEICAEIGISPNTLRTYWSRIRAKIGEVPRSALAVAFSQEVASATSRYSNTADWEADLTAGTIVGWNPTEVSNSLRGATIRFEEAMLAVHPDDRSAFMRFIASLDHNDLKHFSYTLRVVTANGFGRSTSFVRVIRDATGKATRLVGVRSANLDFRAPERERIDIGYWERDFLTGAFTADEHYCFLYGIDPTDPDLRQAAILRFHPDDRQTAATILDRAAAEGKEHFRFTHRLLSPSGVYRWAMCDTRIEYVDGKPVKARGTTMAFDPD